MRAEERYDLLRDIVAVAYFVPITMLVVFTVILLEIYRPATEEFTKPVENGFILLDKLQEKLRFGAHAAIPRRSACGIFKIYGEATFTIRKTNDIIGSKHYYYERILPRINTGTMIQLTSDAA